jgi:ferredoxin
MPQRPKVDEELCIGCGHCAEVCPTVFELIDDTPKVQHN